MTEAIAVAGRLTEWQDRIRAAAAARTPLRIVGAGSKDFYGEASTGERFETSGYSGVIDYDPAELVVTARCGTTLAELQQTLAQGRQMLAFEPPSFALLTGQAVAGSDEPVAQCRSGTLGGAIAAGLAGPRRPWGGAVRDSVLGVRIVDGQGEDLSFGGRVMKNVAGFDVSRLIAGSLGTLGVIADASLKCVPLPAFEQTRVFELGAAESIMRCNEWGGRALPISATCWHEGRLFVRFSGAEPAIASAGRKLGGEAVASADGFWASVRDHRHPFFAPVDNGTGNGSGLWRLSVKSSAPLHDDGHSQPSSPQLIEWGGALRWMRAGVDAAENLRSWARAQGGHATWFRGPINPAGVFDPLTPALDTIHRRLKTVFDPAGILNPGRMFSGL